MKDLKKLYKGFDEEMETWDDDEEDRLEHLLLAKQRGKGAPKKKRTADGETLFYSVPACELKRHANTGTSESKKMKGKKRPPVVAAAPKELKF